MYPAAAVLVDELPKSPTGKILKRSIDRGPHPRELGDDHAGGGWATARDLHCRYFVFPNAAPNKGLT